MKLTKVVLACCLMVAGLTAMAQQNAQKIQTANPIIKHIYTCDPAALVVNDTLYIAAGHEESTTPYNWPFRIKDWHIFSTTDMKNFTDHGAILDDEVFDWIDEDYCWASQLIERDGKFYWYVSNFGSMGVAVADNIFGPYHDPLGKPLVDRKTPGYEESNIDPTVFIDDDGQAYLYWGGETNLKGVKLKENMIEFDGEPVKFTGLKNYEEAPWLFKRNGIYYLAYSTSTGYVRGPIRYAMATSPMGPWKDMTDILGVVHNSFTNHEAIIEYKGQWYIIYHNGALPGGGDYNRSVCIDKLFFNEDGTIQYVEQTTGGALGATEYNNYGPNVYAGVDATCVMPNGVTLNSVIADDGRNKVPVSWRWSVVQGPDSIRVESNSLSNHAVYFKEPGAYVLRLAATDGYETNYDEVNVMVYEEPENKVVELAPQRSKIYNCDIPKKGKYVLSVIYDSRGASAAEVVVNNQSCAFHVIRTTFGYEPNFGMWQAEFEFNKGINKIDMTYFPPQVQKIVVSEVEK